MARPPINAFRKGLRAAVIWQIGGVEAVERMSVSLGTVVKLCLDLEITFHGSGKKSMGRDYGS